MTISIMTVRSTTVVPRTPGLPYPGCISSAPPHVWRTFIAWCVRVLLSEFEYVLTIDPGGSRSSRNVLTSIHVPRCKTADGRSAVVFFLLTLAKYVHSLRLYGSARLASEHDVRDAEKGGASLLSVLRRTRALAPLVSLFFRDGSFTFLMYVPPPLVSCGVYSRDHCRVFGEY